MRQVVYNVVYSLSWYWTLVWPASWELLECSLMDIWGTTVHNQS